jgi:2-polyprenyl-3-methyl-5-hydroxy-6-metoxy-1,4-benzoquinol methylase
MKACPAARFHCLDISSGVGPLVAESFNAITCIEVLEHIYAPELLLSPLFRLLKPDGMLVLTTPYTAT